MLPFLPLQTCLCGLHGLVRYRKPRHSSVVFRHPILNPLLSPVMLSSRVDRLENRARILYAEDRDIAACLQKERLDVPFDELKEVLFVCLSYRGGLLASDLTVPLSCTAMSRSRNQLLCLGTIGNCIELAWLDRTEFAGFWYGGERGGFRRFN